MKRKKYYFLMDDRFMEEERRLRWLRFIVDITQAVLMQQDDLTLREAFAIMDDTKKAALNLFPDKSDVYDLVYGSRLRRIVRERFVIAGGRSS